MTWAFRDWTLSLRGKPLARLQILTEDAGEAQTVNNAVRRATRLLNDLDGAKSAPPYFHPEASFSDRMTHAGLGFVILLLLGGGLYSGSIGGFLAFAFLAFLVQKLQPPR